MSLKSFLDMFPVGRPSELDLGRLRAEAERREVTYDALGATLGTPPAGYHVITGSRVVGAGAETFARAKDAIGNWQAQARMGMMLDPPFPPLVVGTTMAFALQVQPPLPLWATGTCRIVALVDDERSFGFVYGTLPHHPEKGEEAFLVHHRDDDSVEFEITAFSKPAVLPIKLAGPIGRLLQQRALRTYLDGYEAATTG